MTGLTPSPLSSGHESYTFDFRAPTGQVWSLGPIDGLFGNTPAAAANLQAALRALPLHGAGNTVVRHNAGSTSTVVKYDVTFTGPGMTGNQTLLSCPQASMCNDQGCAPRYSAAVLAAINLGAAVTVNEAKTVLAPSVGAVQTVEIETTTSAWRYCEMPVGTLMCPMGGWSDWRVMPVGAARTAVVVGSTGLVVDFGTPTVGSVAVDMGVPQCSVATLQAAGRVNENVVCSDRGFCNSHTGECACLPGYGGQACDRKVTFH